MPNRQALFLNFDIKAQPDEVTCGPTCLHALYQHYDNNISLKQVIQEKKKKKTGGTLAVADAKESDNFRLEMLPAELPGSSAFSSDLFFVLDDIELEKLTPRAAVPYRDPGLKLDRASILRNRQNEQDLLSQNLNLSS